MPLVGAQTQCCSQFADGQPYQIWCGQKFQCISYINMIEGGLKDPWLSTDIVDFLQQVLEYGEDDAKRVCLRIVSLLAETPMQSPEPEGSDVALLTTRREAENGEFLLVYWAHWLIGRQATLVKECLVVLPFPSYVASFTRAPMTSRRQLSSVFLA